jgi:hypothetical protein
MSEDNEEQKSNREDVPEHLRHWPSLLLRDGSQIIEAPPEDQSVVRSYPDWTDKGALLEGRRITVMTRKVNYRPDEEVRVIHVYEVVTPHQLVYVMGPKPVYSEFVDGQQATPALPPGEDPFVPKNYDGRALPSPAVDYNYEITQYRFAEPGLHQIYWQIGNLRSNTLSLEVVRDE